jgi:hypothetical protein
MASIGGRGDTKVKALNGARFAIPEDDSVDTHAIGRGTTIPVISLYDSSADNSLGQISIEGVPCGSQIVSSDLARINGQSARPGNRELAKSPYCGILHESSLNVPSFARHMGREQGRQCPCQRQSPKEAHEFREILQ